MKQVFIVLKKLTVLFCLIYYTDLHAQIGFEFRMDISDIDNSFAAATCDSSGNIYVDYGYKLQNTNLPASVACIYKIDKSGDTIQFNYQKQDTTINYFIPIIDKEQHLLLIGEGYKIDSIGNLSGKFHIFIKMTTSFEILWKKYFHLELDSELVYYGVQAETNRNSYVFARFIEDVSTGNFRMSSFEINKEGDSLNYYQHDPDLIGFLYSITQSQIDSTLLEYHLTVPTGYSTSCGRLQMDESFQQVSIQAYPELHYQNPFYTINYNEKTYLSAGRYGFGSDYIQVRIMDTSLNILNSVNLCYNEDETVPAWFKCIDYHDPNRIFVVGTSPYFSDYEANYIYVACLDSDLDLIHEEYIGGDEHYDVFYIAATLDGGVVISGSYIDVSEEPLQSNGYLVKLDSSMFVGLPENLKDKSRITLEVLPNPADNYISINCSENNFDFELVDLCGKIKYHKVCNSTYEHINISQLSRGIYIWKATFAFESNTGKLLIN